jgi:hypothetical protein
MKKCNYLTLFSVYHKSKQYRIIIIFFICVQKDNNIYLHKSAEITDIKELSLLWVRLIRERKFYIVVYIFLACLELAEIFCLIGTVLVLLLHYFTKIFEIIK